MSQIKKEDPEFQTTMLSEPKSRRSALKAIGSGMTVAALSGCVGIRKPKQLIKTYTKESDIIVPGEPTTFATSCNINGHVNGLTVTTHEGRPIKLDGHPHHPNNYGSSNAYIQAEIHQLYDPDRLKGHFSNQKPTQFNRIKKALSGIEKNESIAICHPPVRSLLEASLLKQIKARYPKGDFFEISPVNKDNQTTALLDATNTHSYLDYDYSSAKIVVSFDHDFLGNESDTLSSITKFIKYQNQFTFVSYSSSLTITDSKANAIINASIKSQEHTLIYIAQELAKTFGSAKAIKEINKHSFNKKHIDTKKTNELIKLLIDHRSQTIVSIGEIHSIEMHKIGLLINQLLNNINRSVRPIQLPKDLIRVQKFSSHASVIERLKQLIENKAIKTLISLDIDLSRFIPNVESSLKPINTFYLSTYKNRFTRLAAHVISKGHFLEEWDLLMSREGHISIQQPVIQPLYKSKSTIDILLALLNIPDSAYTYLKKEIRKRNLNETELKQKGLHKNPAENVSASIKGVSLTKNKDNESYGLILSVKPSYQLLDGKYTNNSWLLETPDPVTKLTWGNAFIISSKFAKKETLKTGDIIQIRLKTSDILKGPVIILPGQNSQTISLSYGYGKLTDSAFSNYGISADNLKSNANYDIASINKTNEFEALADTQMNHGLDEETLAASGIKSRIESILQIKTVEELNHSHKTHEPHSLFKELSYASEYQWGMSVDLNACIGCSACHVACQAENNIPIVGKEETQKGREMSWIRIDRYFIENDSNETTINYMPVACVHCENAPCEQVCPVNATVHDDEGLNVMTYNRCIGTRYCANNCPYKVRRFNFFDWHQKNPQSVKKDRIHLFDYFREPSKQTQKQFNPEVTVRMRGVMEKCSYCLQRISKAKINAKVNDDKSIIDKLQTACQQACPTNAIVFGDINNPSSDVSTKRKSKRRYDLLQYELNTKPRTIYLSKIKKNVWESQKTKETTYGYH